MINKPSKTKEAQFRCTHYFNKNGLMKNAEYVVNKPNGPGYTVSSSVPFAEWFVPTLDEADSIDAEVAKVQMKDMHLPHFFMRTSQGSFTRDAMLVNTGGTGLDLMGSCLFPQGNLSTELLGKHYVDSVSGTQNFKYDPNNEFRHFISANTPFHIIHFSVHPSYLLGFLPENEKWSENLKERINRGDRFMGSRSASITLAQQRVLQNILECPLTGIMATHMMEASIVQLILLQLHALFQAEGRSPIEITKRDKETIHGVREYLHRSFLENHSLECLAKHFGTNTNKLMTLFKKTFNKSIFEYISELKMEFAHRLIQEEGRAVVEVARITGYKNPNHFSTAFKKRFGISPSRLSD